MVSFVYLETLVEVKDVDGVARAVLRVLELRLQLAGGDGALLREQSDGEWQPKDESDRADLQS